MPNNRTNKKKKKRKPEEVTKGEKPLQRRNSGKLLPWVLYAQGTDITAGTFPPKPTKGCRLAVSVLQKPGATQDSADKSASSADTPKSHTTTHILPCPTVHVTQWGMATGVANGKIKTYYPKTNPSKHGLLYNSPTIYLFWRKSSCDQELLNKSLPISKKPPL